MFIKPIIGPAVAQVCIKNLMANGYTAEGAQAFMDEYFDVWKPAPELPPWGRIEMDLAQYGMMPYSPPSAPLIITSCTQ